uniref:Small nuclear rna activating complex snapc subunit snap43 n=1 Tax=Culex tarsalis TaxID=7177 RepID=A0A1Q3G161_CULTA
MVSEISRGFREDCYNFLNGFTSHQSMDFRYFCQEWKRTGFNYVFYARNTEVELVEFTNEALVIVKHIFLAAKLPLDRIGAFYLLYALYFKQPTESFCKIRVSLADWREIKRFVLDRPEDELPQLVVIFWKMFIADAFRFVQDEKEYGYDSFFIKGGESGKYDDKVRESFKIIREAEKDFKSMKSITGLFTALDALEMGYNEMKESLDETEASSSNTATDKIPQSNLMQSLHKDLDAIIKVLSPDEGASAAAAEQEAAGCNNDELAVHSNESIGAKRSSLRERAFRRKINRRDLQIATATVSTTSVGSSGGSPSKGIRPRATKKKGINTSVFANVTLGSTDMSTDEDDA